MRIIGIAAQAVTLAEDIVGLRHYLHQPHRTDRRRNQRIIGIIQTAAALLLHHRAHPKLRDLETVRRFTDIWPPGIVHISWCRIAACCYFPVTACLGVRCGNVVAVVAMSVVASPAIPAS